MVMDASPFFKKTPSDLRQGVRSGSKSSPLLIQAIIIFFLVHQYVSIISGLTEFLKGEGSKERCEIVLYKNVLWAFLPLLDILYPFPGAARYLCYPRKFGVNTSDACMFFVEL
jgi:hypothetical protein